MTSADQYEETGGETLQLVLADELSRTDLQASAGDLQGALAGLAGLRTRLPDIDGVTLAREARTELEHRST